MKKIFRGRRREKTNIFKVRPSRRSSSSSSCIEPLLQWEEGTQSATTTENGQWSVNPQPSLSAAAAAFKSPSKFFVKEKICDFEEAKLFHS